jgi:hypothetical protein
MTQTAVGLAISDGGSTLAAGRLVPEGVDTSHGVILYLDAIEVSFDGFKALNQLSLTLARARPR